MEMRLSFVRENVEVILPANSPTESLQPVAVSDLLTGAKMDIQPLAGDDFQSLLTLLPSIVRGPDGRLRVKGGAPTTGALQVSSASLNDPSTGDFDLELPSGAVAVYEPVAVTTRSSAMSPFGLPHRNRRRRPPENPRLNCRQTFGSPPAWMHMPPPLRCARWMSLKTLP